MEATSAATRVTAYVAADDGALVVVVATGAVVFAATVVAARVVVVLAVVFATVVTRVVVAFVAFWATTHAARNARTTATVAARMVGWGVKACKCGARAARHQSNVTRAARAMRGITCATLLHLLNNHKKTRFTHKTT